MKTQSKHSTDHCDARGQAKKARSSAGSEKVRGLKFDEDEEIVLLLTSGPEVNSSLRSFHLDWADPPRLGRPTSSGPTQGSTRM